MSVNLASQDLIDLPYVPLVPYNDSTATGGNSLTTDLNVYYQSGDIAWWVVLSFTSQHSNRRFIVRSLSSPMISTDLGKQDDHVDSARPAHDSRRRLLLLGACTTQICSIFDLFISLGNGCGLFPMVLLGILLVLFARCRSLPR